MPILPNTPIANVVPGTFAVNNPLPGTAAADLILGGRGADNISGQVSADLLFGNRGADTINGNQGADVIVWTNGDGSDTVNGGPGVDTQVVEGSNDTTAENFRLSQTGGNVVFERLNPNPFKLTETSVERFDFQGQAGDDALNVQSLGGTVQQIKYDGGEGIDRLTAQLADAPIVAEGGPGGDILSGGTRSDQLQGGADGDTLRGFGGSDWLVGGEGDDTLQGGTGRDVLEGYLGNDRLFGGAEGDFFILEAVEGEDIILDFAKGPDKIVLSNYSDASGPIDFSNLTLETATGDTVIDLSQFVPGNPTASLTIDGVTTLDATDFVFL